MSKDFIPFAQERVMSKWENVVDYNLGDSGVHPMTTQELIDDPVVSEEVLSMGLYHPQANGILELREHIALLYPGASPDNVLVTSGAAQANFTSLWALLSPGDEIVVLLPNYLQIWGVAKNFGLQVKTFRLREDRGWALDLDELNGTVSDKTKLIAVCNPNNPSGHIMTPQEMDGVVAAAARVGAWLLADEVYAGTERATDEVTASFWGRYDRVLAIGSMSKAYGMPGLRIGWIVTTKDLVEEVWARQEYVTIGSAMLDNKLAAYALSPEVRPRVVARTRDFVRNGYGHFERWAKGHGELFTWVPPQAAPIAFARYDADINSSDFGMRLIHEQSVQIVPGDHFGMDGYLRFSFGLPEDYLLAGLARISQLIATIPW
ncbi:MAG: aminotransferase class I/II-fold pyridoxal phosphate-dependent enzyme [Gemmatimonadetes bacterium]|nr:aminotransferase class I/II-fold pyridoxal phosphate-dependent enzyme [Gemmatimonadota bacterium]NNM06479.1 aminotransferase class I/II-fold pyridoxal phosphate-dependent enzyme [Gemmatimonadota bacterium]